MRAMSRRHFLYSALAAGGGLALPRLLDPDAFAAAVFGREAPESRRLLTAGHWGMYGAVVQDGRLVSVEPFAKDTHPTRMIEAFPAQVYAGTRVGSPAVRKSFLERGAKSDRALRGREPFVRVSWDHALDLVAGEIKRVKSEHGNASLFAGTVDWQSAGLLHNANAVVRRLLGLAGGFTDNSGDYSIECAMVILPHVLGALEVYSEQSAWPSLLANTKVLVLWGCCPMKNNQIGTHPSDHAAYGALEKLRARKDIEILCIDPRYTDSAEYLGARWIAPRPNTDTALMLGIAHELYTTKLHDKAFLEKYTYGFDKFLPYLLGESDRTPKSPEWAASITGIDAGTIRELARKLASPRTMILTGYAIQRADHGEQPYWMLVALASMIGQIGLPGGGIGFSYHYDNGGDLQAAAPGFAGLSAGDNPVKDAVPVARTVADMLLNPGKEIDYNGGKVKYPDIRLIYWAGGNPLSHQYQINRMLEAWQRPETLIVQDPFWTASARFADIVLPATTGFERNDIEFCGTYSQQYLVAMPQVIEPVGESRNDYDICAGIAQRLGVYDAFTDGKKDQIEWLRSFYAAAQQPKEPHPPLPSFDEFWRRGYLEFPVPPKASSYTTFADFRANPAAHALGTASGRIEIFCEPIARMGYADCPGHPVWIEPAEWLGSAQAKQHPLHLVSPHPPHRLHSQLDNTWIREWYEVAEREPVFLHPEEAKSRGIRHGDVVRVFNDRGELLAGAVVTERIRPGVACIHEGAWYDPLEPGRLGTLCKHGLVNLLTLDKGASSLSQGGVANTALVQVERYAAEPPPISAFRSPQVEAAKGA